MKKFLFFLLCISSVTNILGSDAVTFTKCSWTEESGNMILHLDLDVFGYKDKNLSANAYFYNSDGTKLSDTNGRYNTNEGQVAAHVDIKPKYDGSHWDDLQIVIPVSELHPRPGKNDYYIDFYVHDGHGFIGSISKACSYSLTGSHHSDNNSSSDYNSSSSNNTTCSVCNGSGTMKCIICNGTGNDPNPKPIVNHYTHQITWQYIKCIMCGGNGIKTCAACYGTGLFVPPAGGSYNSAPDFNSGSGSSSSVYTTCSRCGGSGTCRGCGGGKGSWEYIDHYTGDGKKGYIPCGECRGSGKCPICYGRGKL